MSEWIEYTGSDEQIAEMLDAVENGFRLNSTKAAGVFKGGDFMSSSHLFGYLEYCEATHYLICQPHPYADMIDRWRQTGQPVWVRYAKVCHFGQTSEYEICNQIATPTPDWNIPGAEYSFTPFEGEV